VTSPTEIVENKGRHPCAVALCYEGEVKTCIRRYKFHGAEHLAPVLGERLAAAVDAQLGRDFDLVTWAPLGKKRLRQRGYDQARLLAGEVAKRMNLPQAATLEKRRDTAQQSTLTAQARQKNAKNVYRLKPGTSVRGKRILLIDDVTTTGSTLGACAQVLMEQGAAYVACGAVAHSREQS
jgi:ComF family protein